MKNLIAIPVLLFLTLACTQKEDTPTDTAEDPHVNDSTLTLTEEQVRAAGIELGKVQDKVLTGTVVVTGLLDVPPQNMVVITAPFGGFLRSTTMLQGMRVTKGQKIAVFENPEYIQLQQDYLDSKSQVVFLEAEYQRQEELARENVNAQKTLQKSLADLNSMKARNNGLRSKLIMLNLAPDRLDAGTIRSTIELLSPITGYVTQVNAAVGAFASPTDPIFRIVDTAHLHAELTVFERDIPKIKIGQQIRFTLANETAERTAHVFLIGREISTDRTIRVHGHLDKEDPDLIPGMYLKAQIETGGKPLPALPEEAVIRFEDSNYIFIEEGNVAHRFIMIKVTTGLQQNGFIEVRPVREVNLSSLQVVVRGAHKLLSKLKNSEIGDQPGH